MTVIDNNANSNKKKETNINVLLYVIDTYPNTQQQYIKSNI